MSCRARSRAEHASKRRPFLPGSTSSASSPMRLAMTGTALAKASTRGLGIGSSVVVGRTRYAADCSLACRSSASRSARSISSTRAAGARLSASRRVATPLSAAGSPTKTPPERRARLLTRLFGGPPASGAVLDGRRATHLGLWSGLLRRRQRRDSYLAARTIDPQLSRGGFLPLGVLAMLVVALLVALRAAAQASRGVEVPGGSGGGTHGSIPFSFMSASRPSVFREASSRYRRRGPRLRCVRS